MDFSRLRRIIFQEELSFKLEHYKIPAQTLLRLIVGLEEQAPLSLLLDAGKYVLHRAFSGISILSDRPAKKSQVKISKVCTMKTGMRNRATQHLKIEMVAVNEVSKICCQSGVKDSRWAFTEA